MNRSHAICTPLLRLSRHCQRRWPPPRCITPHCFHITPLRTYAATTLAAEYAEMPRRYEYASYADDTLRLPRESLAIRMPQPLASHALE